MFETDLLSYFVMCDELKLHGYNIFEINESMPWHLDLLTEALRVRLSKKNPA